MQNYSDFDQMKTTVEIFWGEWHVCSRPEIAVEEIRDFFIFSSKHESINATQEEQIFSVEICTIFPKAQQIIEWKIQHVHLRHHVREPTRRARGGRGKRRMNKISENSFSAKDLYILKRRSIKIQIETEKKHRKNPLSIRSISLARSHRQLLAPSDSDDHLHAVWAVLPPSPYIWGDFQALAFLIPASRIYTSSSSAVIKMVWVVRWWFINNRKKYKVRVHTQSSSARTGKHLNWELLTKMCARLVLLCTKPALPCSKQHF